MTEPTPGTPPVSFEKEFTLSDSVMHAFGDYRKTAELARSAMDTLKQIEVFIQLVNGGWLPRDQMVMTEIESLPSVSMQDERNKEETRRAHYPEHGTIVYRPDPNKQFSRYIPDGELVTFGSRRTFLGDRFEVVGGEMVLINTELQVGVNVHGTIRAINKAQHESDFLDSMQYVEEARGGAQKVFDLARY